MPFRLIDDICFVCKGGVSNKHYFQCQGKYFCCKDHFDKWIGDKKKIWML